ncbi:MAG TPA: NAD(P)-binding domain-containing protein [Anaerolineales bacterium]|nr:NAD(P)-binding domain-containing protein [Anaerolineales bacterium]
MQKIGILGTGIVGQTLGLKLVQLGHSVMLGTRDPSKLDEPKGWNPDAPTLRDWLAITGSQGSVGTFRDAATIGDLVINATNGAASLEVLRAVGEEHLDGKTLIDVSNPMDFSNGFPPTLFVKDTDSLGEILQREFPNVRVVKTLNAGTADLMVNPKLVGNGDHTVFLSGNDVRAKAQVTELLRELGWDDILDLGEISTARGPEMMFAIAHSAMRALSPAPIAFKVVR